MMEENNSQKTLKDSYFFYFPSNTPEQSEEAKAFENICIDLADGMTAIYPARGTWIDPSGLKVEDKVTVINVSGNFTREDSILIESIYHATLKEMGEHSSFFNRNGLAHIREL